MASLSALKLAQIVCACTWCLLSAGVVFGFAAFKAVLVQEGVYSELCFPEEGSTSVQQCIEQDMKLNTMFTIAAAVTNMAALPVGSILDWYGPRVTTIIGAGFIALGSLLFIWCRELRRQFDPFVLGFISLAIGGPFVFISCFHLSSSFPKRSGTIMALITGCFDTSSAIFLFYRIAYDGKTGGISLSSFFKLYLLVPAFIIICQLTIMPHKSYKTTVSNTARFAVEGLDENGQLLPGDTGSDIIPNEEDRAFLLEQQETFDRNEATPPLAHRRSILESYMEINLIKKSGGIFGVLHGKTASEQIATPWFVLMVIFAAVCMIRINYFVATIHTQEEYLLGDIQGATSLNHIFDIALPLGGVVAIPFIGAILDHLNSIMVMALLASVSTIIAILGLIPHAYQMNLVGILLFVAYRPFYYTVVSDYSSKVFGFDTFGTVYGLLTCICGLCNILQNRLDKWTHTTFKMNPTPINVALLLATLTSAAALLAYMQYQVQHRDRKPHNLYEDLPEGPQYQAIGPSAIN